MENTLKTTIKTMSAEQSSCKEQRKTVYFQGERKLSASEATALHLHNRQKLRLLYVAYALLRDKDPIVAVGNYDPQNVWEVKAVEKYVKEYEAYFKARKEAYEQSALHSSQQES